MFRKIHQIHFVGIGGSGMSGIAEVLLNLGYKVTGSDLRVSDTTRRLESKGGKIYTGHAPLHIEGAQVIVTSSAVSKNNVEVRAAIERHIPVIPRAEMLAELMRMKYSIAIAGSHGKTTTTSMVATVLAQAGFDPTVVLGGKLNVLGSNAKLGQGEFLVAEADESDGSFLLLSPTIAVVTTIDKEHIDHYKDMDNIKKGFLNFINKVPFYGMAVICLDQPNIKALIPQITKRYMTYSIEDPDADLCAGEIRLNEWRSEFHVSYKKEDMGRFRLSLPGLHSVYNALAAIGVAIELEIDIEAIKEGLSGFSGVERRFQLKGEKNGVMVIDDYGHHPTEIEVTLNALKGAWDRRVIALFQPHRFTRTRDLMEEFAYAFNNADILLLTEIYPAGEEPIKGISGQRLYEYIKENGKCKDIFFIEKKEDIVEKLLKLLKPNDIVITLGAGDIWKIGKELLERL
ncbi:MAG: UDP-N-acetylmuramate--L-alanine ligase [Nitrospirota bacterium]